MSTNTTNMSMGKAVDGDNSKTYLETTLGNALDTIDAHDHSTNAKGLAITRLGATVTGALLTITGGVVTIASGEVITAGGLQITAGGLVVTAGATAFGVGAGQVTISSGSIANPLAVNGSLTGATQQALALSPTLANASGSAQSLWILPTTAASFTSPFLAGIRINSPSFGATQSITNLYGIYLDPVAAPAGITNNYGVYINAPSGGATDNVSVYVTGSGTSFFGAGSCVFGNPVLANSATTGFIYCPRTSGTPTGTPVTTGLMTNYVPMLFDSSGSKLWAWLGGAWKGVVLS